MRNTPNLRAEKFRLCDVGEWSSTQADGNNGAFRIGPLLVIVSDGGGWDHVSVSLRNRCPDWDEMCAVKDIFFRDDEVAMQLHPATSEYRNFHTYCLHMWRPQHAEIPLPPPEMVAPPELGG